MFDLDGTLTDPKEGITKSIQYALSSLGIEERDPDALCAFIGPPLQRVFAESYGMNSKETERAISKYRERFSAEGIFENEVYPGVDEMLASLKADGACICLATSKPTVYAERILDHFGLSRHFDQVVGSELDGTRSAKTDVVREVLSRLEWVDLADCVMVGDRGHDAEGAKACGIDAVGVLYGYGSREELVESGAKLVVGTVNELGDLLRS